MFQCRTRTILIGAHARKHGRLAGFSLKLRRRSDRLIPSAGAGSLAMFRIRDHKSFRVMRPLASRVSKCIKAGSPRHHAGCTEQGIRATTYSGVKPAHHIGLMIQSERISVNFAESQCPTSWYEGIYANSGSSIENSFYYKASRCYEIIKLEPTATNLKRGYLRRMPVIAAISNDAFDYPAWRRST